MTFTYSSNRASLAEEPRPLLGPEEEGEVDDAQLTGLTADDGGCDAPGAGTVT